MEGGKRLLFLFLSCLCLSRLFLPTSGTDDPPESTRGASRGGQAKTDTSFQSGASSQLEWQVLTKRNFSSQIRAHSNILLLVTVPWSGESRSLKKDVVNVVSEIQDEIGDLKLMLVHKNSDKLISDVLGAVEELTVYYYHHSKRFKYRGRMNARAILSSVLNLMSLQPEEVPLKSLNSEEELRIFLDSTDESILLVEFCGWSRKILQQRYSGSTGNSVAGEGLYGNGESTGENFTASGALLFDGKEKLKDVESEKLTCSVDDIKPPWFEASVWSTGNNSFAASQEKTGNGVYCSENEFKKFMSFFSKFMEVAGESLLPPERLQFGYISHKSLLSYLDIESPDNWMLLHWIHGCRNCSKTLQDGDELRAILMFDTPVMELDGDRNGRDFSFPMNRPSIILFIDRSSNSSKVSEDSKSALHIFKMLAQENRHGKYTGTQLSVDSIDVSYNLKGFTKSSSDVASHLISKSSMKKIIKFNDQMTVMVIKQGEQISPDGRADVAQGSNTYDLLARLLHQRNPALSVEKRGLNLLAKEAGFQLSDGFEIEVSESLPSDKENDQSDTKSRTPVLDRQVSEYPSEIIDHTLAYNVKSSDGLQTKNPLYNKAAISNSESSTKFVFQQSGDETHTKQEAIEKEVINDEKYSAEDEESSLLPGAARIDKPTGISYQHIRFEGSYYVSDGDYTLVRSLTGASKLPAVVILDPYVEKHYIYEGTDLSYSSLSTFVEKYLNESLYPYQFTEPSPVYHRENPQPPFVNLDFHEADAIPRMTLKMFSERVRISRQSDILVLFTNSWCGFCQRMELVVREVYRSLKGFMSWSKSGCTKGQTHNPDEPDDVTQLVMPSIFYMDCTLNDCSFQFNQLGKKEHYPALVLFLAEGDALFFEGDASVNSVIEFIVKYGSISGELNRYKGVLWTQRYIEQKDTGVLYDSLPISTPSSIANSENKHSVISEAIIGGNGHLLIDLQQSVETQVQEENVIVGSVLSATDKLLNAFPFDNSSVLIVKADRDEGFHGMILNKRMNWEVFAKLEEVVAPLKQAPLSYGGPVRVPNLPFVSLSQRAIQGYTKVSTGLYYGDPMSTGLIIEEIRIGNQSSANLWFFFGFSGWEWNQLFVEIGRGDWHLSDGPIEHLQWPDS